MSKTVTYYLSLNSPWSFMGGERLAEIAKKHGATVDVRPIHLGLVFEQTGGLPLPKRSPQRQAYRLTELERWSKYLGIPLVLKPAFFPTDDKPASALVYCAQAAGKDGLALANRIGRKQWVEEKNIAEDSVLAEAADEAYGSGGAALVAQSKDPKYLVNYTGLCQAAMDAGVFGAPTYIYKDEIFWGQDRLQFLDAALGG